MQQFTKRAITEAFIELLNERPFDKITVTDITNRCGVNRNTFYYYYQDIYALVDEVLRDEAAKLVDEHREFLTWQEGFFEAMGFARQNSKAIYHLYNSVNRARLEEYIYEMSFNTVSAFVLRQSEGMEVRDEDVHDITVLYTVAIEGLMLDWLHVGMKEDPEEYLNRIGDLFEGVTKHALYKSHNTLQKERLGTAQTE